MAYGAIKVDNITFTNNGADQATTVSGLYRAITSGVTVTGTLSGNTIQGSTGIFGAGSVTAPSVAIGVGTTYAPGIYSPGTDQLAATTAGKSHLYINASGQVAISSADVTAGAPEPWPIPVSVGYPPTLTLQNGYYQCLVLSNRPTSAGNIARYGAIASARYSPSHKAFTVLGMGDSGSGRQIYIGGGGWNTPDATDINFYTAPTYTETDDTGLLRMYIDAAGNVAIDANSTSFVAYPIRLHVAANGSDYYQTIFSGYGNNATGGYLGFYQTRGSSANANGAVQTNDYLGVIDFAGNIGSGGLDNAQFGAEIAARAEANWTSSTNHPGYLSFDTSPGTTDPVERMRITAAGIVLVGTSSASGSSLLQVNSDALINGITVGRGTGGVSTNTAVGNNALLSNTTGAFNTCIGYQAGQSLTTGNNNTIIGSIAGTAGLSDTVIIGAGSAERLRIDSSGKVGIGTNAPSSLLSISTTLGASVFDMTVPGVASGGFYIDNTSPYSFVSTANAFAWKVWNGAGFTEQMRIDSAGNAGIGTTTPGAKLDVVGSLALTNKVLSTTATGVGGGNAVAGYGHYISCGAANANTTFTALYAEVNYQNQSSYAAYFTNPGNAATASYGLYVQGRQPDVNGGGIAYAGYFNATASGSGATGSTYGLYVNNAATVGLAAYGLYVNSATGATSTIPFSVAVNGSESVRVTSTSELVVGASATVGSNKVLISVADQNALGIKTGQGAGTQTLVRFYDSTNTVCGAISIDSGANTTTYGTSSDYRLKQDVTELTNSTSRLSLLKPVNFKFIADDLNRTFDGFIAHEVQAVVPEAVVGEKDAVDAENNPILQVIDQSKLVPLLTAALQEALTRIEQLEAAVANLQQP